ncbi:MAG: complex I subunit 5 family protein [Desulfurococcaceae archaeon]
MEIYFFKMIPLAILLMGHIPKVRGNSTGSILRVIGYSLLMFNITFTNPVSDALLLASIVIGVVITLYTMHYSRLKYNKLNLLLVVDLFTISMIFVFTSKYLLEFITFWLLTELLGFFLIAYDYITAGERLSIYAAVKYLLFSMIPTDISLFILLALTGFSEAFDTELLLINPMLTSPLISFIVVLGFFSKAAVFPLHFWLPDAHSVAPSPASALLSGIMVKMGIYGLYLLTNYNINKDLVVLTMLVFGGFTVVYGALQAIVQKDIKRILAYSTTSNTALITLVLALYMLSSDRVFLEAAILYTLIHALYKSALFLDSGFVEVLTHHRDVNELGYISKIYPMETTAIIISILVILGLPPSIGFLAKVFLFSSISKYLGDSSIYLVALLIVSSKVFLSIIYNVGYLRAHIGGEIKDYMKLNLGASTLQPYVLALVSMTFVTTFIIMLFDYSGLTEFTMLRKLTPPLITSFVLLVFAGLFIFRVLMPTETRG